MLLLYGGMEMLIRRMIVKKLHGIYNYSIEFNKDITFIYGANGCGKTTVLNILSYIISGNIYDLSSFKFDLIELSLSGNDNKHGSIVIKKEGRNLIIEIDKKIYNLSYNEISNNNKRNMNWNDEDYLKWSNEYYKEDFYRNNEDIDLVSGKLKKLFNEIYLPLNRAFNINDNFKKDRNKSLHNLDLSNMHSCNSYLNESIDSVLIMIKEYVLRINVETMKIDEEFKKKVITNSFNYQSNNADFSSAITYAMTQKKTNLNKDIDGYITILKKFDFLDEGDFDDVHEFRENINTAFEKFQNEREGKKENQFEVSFILMCYDLLKMKSITNLARKYEEKKLKVLSPIDEFSKIVNEFLIMGDFSKMLLIDQRGRVSINLLKSNQKISLNELSSGEKQLIIMFSYLIFGISNKKQGIFIVDEPESSLHLIWQNIFVKSLIRANQNVQFIFATHSPEIISFYEDKVYELKAEY